MADSLASVRGGLQKLQGVLDGSNADWRRQLLPASFRGVPFKVLDSRISGDHANVFHEFVDRAGSLSEPGEPTSDAFTLTGYVVGDSYFQARDALIAALREKGVGRLVHPYHGEMDVVVGAWECAESRGEGRIATFSISATRDDTPSVIKASAVQGGLLDAANKILDSATKTLTEASSLCADALKLATMPARIVKDAQDRISTAVTLAYKRIRSAGEDVYDTYMSLTSDLLPFLASSATNKAALDAAQAIVASVDDFQALMRLSAAYAELPYEPSSTAAAYTERVRETNAAQIDRFFAITYLAQASIAATEYEFASYDEAIIARDVLCLRLVRTGLNELAGLTFTLLTLRAGSSQRIIEHEAGAITSTLELAQDLYGDGSRADELLALNAIEHPGFVRGKLKAAEA